MRKSPPYVVHRMNRDKLGRVVKREVEHLYPQIEQMLKNKEYFVDIIDFIIKNAECSPSLAYKHAHIVGKQLVKEGYDFKTEC